jgi:glycosyltransferase involved in cell wall biosynthesis
VVTMPELAVVYQSPYPPQIFGGGDRRVRDLTRGLASRCDGAVMLNAAAPDGLPANADEDVFRVEYLGQAGGRPRSPMERLRFWWRVLRFVRRNHVRIVMLYNTTLESAVVARWLRARGVVVLYEICDLMSQGSNSAFLRMLTKRGEELLPRCSSLNIVISDYLAGKVRAASPHVPLVQVPILVDTDTFHPRPEAAAAFRQARGIPPECPLIAYAGGTWKLEGLVHLIEAFHRIHSDYPEARLCIAGHYVADDQHDDVVAMAAGGPARDRILLPGTLTTDEVVALYSAADVLAVPQIRHAFNQAGLPTKLAEYSAMSRAIVATDVGDVRKYFSDGNAAVICEPSSSAAIATALSALISDPDLRRRLAVGAAGASKRFLPSRAADVIMDAVASIAKPPR